MVNINKIYEYLKNTDLRDMDFDHLSETQLSCRNEIESLSSNTEDDRIHDLLEVIEEIDSHIERLEHLPDWETIVNNPDHPDYEETRKWALGE